MQEITDAVIVGGGILGASLAHALCKKSGMKVTLLDSKRCGSVATSNGFAWVNASTKWEDEAYFQMNLEGVRRYRTFAMQGTELRGGWHDGGSLFWTNGTDDALLVEIRRRCDILNRMGCPSLLVSAAEMRALEPNLAFPDTAAGLFVPMEGWVDTGIHIRLLLDRARHLGASIVEYNPVIKIEQEHNGKVSGVRTSKGTIVARYVIIAAGVGAPELLSSVKGVPTGFANSLLRPASGILVEAPSQPDDARLYRVVSQLDESGIRLRPSGSGLLFGAQDTDALCEDALALEDQGGSLTKGLEFARQTLCERTQAILPNFVAADALHRVCYRPMPLDERPIVGEVPGVVGLYLMVSHSGVTLASVLAQALSSEIHGSTRLTSGVEYSPKRFLPASNYGRT